MRTSNLLSAIIIFLLIVPISSAQFTIGGELGRLGETIKANSPFSQPHESESTVFPYHSPELYFSNECIQPAKLIIALQRTRGKWETLGWWNVGGKDSTYLANQNRRIILASPTIYYYAETTGRARPQLVWKGEYNIDFEGKSWPMRKTTLNVENSDYVFSINCDKTPAFFTPDTPEAGIIDIAPPIRDSSKQPPPPT